MGPMGKGKGVDIIVAGPIKPKGEKGPDGGEAAGSKSAAVDSIMSAIQEGDRGALESALTTFVDACRDYEG